MDRGISKTAKQYFSRGLVGYSLIFFLSSKLIVLDVKRQLFSCWVIFNKPYLQNVWYRLYISKCKVLQLNAENLQNYFCSIMTYILCPGKNWIVERSISVGCFRYFERHFNPLNASTALKSIDWVLYEGNTGT